MTRRAGREHELDLAEACWRMKGRNGRVLECGVYRTTTGLEVRCGYGERELLRSQYAVEIGTARDVAEQWRQAVLAKGEFAELE